MSNIHQKKMLRSYWTQLDIVIGATRKTGGSNWGYKLL